MRSATSGDAVVAEGLVKRYGTVRALDGLDLRVRRGTVMALLGPNGAGKTTTVRILTTLLTADAGRASVAGIDVGTDPVCLRRVIGLSGQYCAVDEDLTGFENLDMVGRLYHLGRRGSRARAWALLDRFDLLEAARRVVKSYSGGMRRRLDLACALVGAPSVLFLDEPTTGLDPRSRHSLWVEVKELVAEGTTLLLTTQYLEEADRLADDIAVIDHGRVIAEGTADSLKAGVGGERIELRVGSAAQVGRAADALVGLGTGSVTADERLRELSLPVTRGADALAEALRRLSASRVDVLDISMRRPTLDDVFLALTGRPAGDGAAGTQAGPAGQMAAVLPA